MNGILLFLQHNAKAVAAFVAGLILNAITAVVNGQVPWPTSLAEWGKYLGTSVLAGVMVWLTGNKLTEQQIVKGAVQQGVTVITNSAINTVRDVAESAVKTATADLPATAQGVVNDVTHQVSTAVGNVLKDVASNFPGFPSLDLKNVA